MTATANATYGRDMVDLYDALLPPATDQPEATTMLAGLASGGRVLELGVGNGRLAVPLAAAGVEVHGVDVSDEMLAVLHDRDATGTVSSTRADFLDLDLPDRFDVVLLAGNTLGQLVDRDDQIALLRCMRRHLCPGGIAVVEAADPTRLHSDPGATTTTLPIGDQLLHETVSVDPVHQLVSIVRMLVDPGTGTMRTFHEIGRYAWPAEIDLMASVAGLGLGGRYRDWHRSPYGAGADRHISLYHRTAPEGADG
jgi:ubiquinone/menaquinone biosynthesis C-methylase UbiE